ncbi:MAG: Tat pathway signal protein [Phycisphaerales bacterium]|nr:Tat pathway signal protein [Hyphomonadaceae bacterium]
MAHPTLPAGIIKMMASRAHRVHHLLWHAVRSGWLFYDNPTRVAITALGWAPPRPALRPGPNGAEIIYDNASGEDFLYMHREMIGAVNKRLGEIGDAAYPRITAWPEPPPATDADWPVPPAFSVGDPPTDAYIAECKSEKFYHERLMAWAGSYRTPATLRSLTLGELGARIEFTIHNRMHMRWCAPISQMRPDSDPATPDTIDAKWDALSYDWLGDTYSSHVHPTFWKLHGWVDVCIDHWARANNVSGPIPWKGTWTGPFPSAPPHHSIFAEMLAIRAARELSEPAHDHGGHDAHHLATMIKVAKLVQASGIACHFYDPIFVEEI